MENELKWMSLKEGLECLGYDEQEFSYVISEYINIISECFGKQNIIRDLHSQGCPNEFLEGTWDEVEISDLCLNEIVKLLDFDFSGPDEFTLD